MPITVIGSRTLNTLNISEALLRDGKGTIALNGEGSVVTIGEECHVVAALNITLAAGSTVRIGRGCLFGYTSIFTGAAATVEIGDKVGFNGSCRMMAHEPATIRLGNACLIASDTQMMASDMHSVVDVQTGRRINPARDIELGDRVWLAERVTVLRGVRIGEGSVIGFGSVVTQSIPDQCVAAGVPARVIRSKTSWDFELLPS